MLDLTIPNGLAFTAGCGVGAFVMAMAVVVGQRLHDQQPPERETRGRIAGHIGGDPRLVYRETLAEMRAAHDREPEHAPHTWQVTHGGNWR